MDWSDVPETVDRWTECVAAPTWLIKRAAARAFTVSDVGYYIDPTTEKVALYSEAISNPDLETCKEAAESALGPGSVRECFLSYQELADPHGTWVKVAYSPVLRRLGELLNFFPGQYPGGIPNHPSPLAAMLTSGAVGAGLGWGAGQLASSVLPEGYGDNLGRTGMLLGGAAGASLGAPWAAANLAEGKSLLDPSPLNTRAGERPAPSGQWLFGNNKELAKIGAAMDEIGLPDWYTMAIKRAWGDTMGTADPREQTSSDVDVNALGQTLWELEASPQLAGTTMGTMFTAQQLPDPRSRPNFVTGGQLGQLAMNATGDYARGLLVGRVLNAVVGTPHSAPAIGAGAAVLGLIGTVIPKLFGR